MRSPCMPTNPQSACPLRLGAPCIATAPHAGSLLEPRAPCMTAAPQSASPLRMGAPCMATAPHSAGLLSRKAPCMATAPCSAPCSASLRQPRVVSITVLPRVHSTECPAAPRRCPGTVSAAEGAAAAGGAWGAPRQAPQRRPSPAPTGALSGAAGGASTFPDPPEVSGAPEEEGANDDDDLDQLFAEGRPTLRSLAGYVQTILKRRVRAVRRWLFLKLLMLLMGFFFANALSTVVGQTGDWDILVAGFLVGMIESLGWFIHRVPRTRFWKRLPPQADDALAMVNYFKCGLIFGLFTDCFKVGS